MIGPSETLKKGNKYRVLFFGLGSIGSRLARLVREHFNHDVYAYRSRKETVDIPGIQEIYDLDKLKSVQADIAFITNPTSLHVETAIQCAYEGMHLYVEKPLSHSLDQLPLLMDLVKRENLLTHVGCILRFDPILQQVKKVIDNKDISRAEVICASYLPEWRPDRDYRESYSAKRTLGGGVLIDLIHEPDYCQWLFGPIEHVEGKMGKISDLEIETEDYADLTLFHACGIQSHVHLDYFSKEKQRKIEVSGNGFYLEGDLVRRTLKTITGGVETLEIFPEPARDDLYISELKHFFMDVETASIPMNNFTEHLFVLKPILEFRDRVLSG